MKNHKFENKKIFFAVFIITIILWGLGSFQNNDMLSGSSEKARNTKTYVSSKPVISLFDFFIPEAKAADQVSSVILGYDVSGLSAELDSKNNLVNISLSMQKSSQSIDMKTKRYLADVSSTSTPICGDGICNGSEDYSTCTDCGFCGNQTCESEENFGTCPDDCDPQCGDGYCEGDESCGSCVSDCLSDCYCGDGLCTDAAGEDCGSCYQDCSSSCSCGDGWCTGTETCGSCVSDCLSDCYCGDGLCTGAIGENCDECAADCGSCSGGSKEDPIING